jgi:two-component system alkaline phosphatase synthesis response regulator PhoP
MSDAPKILVVDDEPPLRELVIVTLGDAYACDEAADGDAALEQLRTQRYDVVMLDVMMPGRSGIDVLREMRSDDDLREIPVVVMSAWQSTQDIDAALAAGADGFLPKPFLLEELDLAVRTAMGSAA